MMMCIFLVGWEMGHSSTLALVGHYLMAFLAMVAANNCEQLWLELALLVVQEIISARFEIEYSQRLPNCKIPQNMSKLTAALKANLNIKNSILMAYY